MENKANKIRFNLILTHNCPLKCVYCSIQKTTQKMSKKILEKILNLIFSSKNYNEFTLIFTGGEPLLEFPLIRHAVQSSGDLSKKYNKIINFHIVTNGVLLNSVYRKFLIKNNFRIDLSIDGDQATQTTHRRWLNYKRYKNNNSYNVIIKNLPFFFKTPIDIRAMMVVHSHNVTNCYINFLHLLHLGFRSIFISPVSLVEWSDRNINIFRKELVKIGSLYLKFMLNHKNIFIENIHSWKSPINLIADQSRSLTVDCNGDIHLGDFSWGRAIHGGAFYIESINNLFVFEELLNVANNQLKILRKDGKKIEKDVFGKFYESNYKAGKVMLEFCSTIRSFLHNDPNK